MTEAIILAGGLGTRLRGVVPDAPKAMAPIAGVPFLAYLLRFLEANGMRRIVLAVGHRSEAIRDFFGCDFGNVKLVYSVEKEPLGTGGALLQAIPYIDEPFAFVVNGDTLLCLNYQEMASVLESHTDAQLVVALRFIEDAGRYGAALVAGDRIQGFTARGTSGPGLINAGSYLLSRDLFRRYAMPVKFSWEEDFLQARAAEVQPLAYRSDVRFIDIGIPEAFERAQTLVPSWVTTNN